MAWQLTGYVVPTLLGTAVAVLLAGYAVQTLRTRGADPTMTVFLAVAVAAAVWTGFSALKLSATDPATKLLFYRLLHVGVAALPPLFVLFVLAYTDRTQWFRRDVLALLTFPPICFLVLLFTNPADLVVTGLELMRGDLVVLRVTDGPVFGLFFLYSAVVTVCALALVLYEATRIGSTYYPQAAWIGVGAMAPIVFSGLTIAGVPPFDSGVNLVPIAGVVSSLAFGSAVFRYRLFELPPLAYTTAMKYSPDGLLVLDDHERIVHANPSGQRLLEKGAVGIGSRLTELFSSFEPTTASDALFEIRTDSGEVTYFRAVVEPLVRGGQTVGWAVVLRDVTEQQRRQEKLKQQAEQLDAFASTVSHDLRNPLSVAQGHVQLAKEGKDTASLEKVAAAHERMDEIITGLLTLAKEGKQIDETVSVSVPEIVSRTWENVDTASATLRIDSERSVEADETMLQHVFENLFRNAVEHGGSDVQIRVGDLDNGLFVEDTGTGIPEQDRGAVLESGVTTTQQGTGYGLQIVDSVVDAHGWDLHVTDGTDGGARFEITGLG